MTPKSGNKAGANNVPETTPARPDPSFRCRFCGEDKPLSDLVMIRHYYPPLAACRDCFKINNNVQ
jgi:hypothetical protein